MEGLRLRIIIIAVLLAASGIGISVTRQRTTGGKTEAWMEEKAPKEILGFEMQVSAENPEQSYKMDQVTYDTLQPFGIVARVYRSDSEMYDVVLVASQSKDSFHDPRVCFSAQGWTLERQWLDQIKTETRGWVPLTITQMTSNGGDQKFAAFLYRGPGGFFGNTQKLKFGMFTAQLRRATLVDKPQGTDDLDGVFYRFIPMHENADPERLKLFIAAYLDAAKATSDGYF